MLAQKKHKKESIEFINDLRHPVRELLEQYRLSNRKYPKRLVFYRDGISEGEFEKVLFQCHKVPSILKQNMHRICI
jgi:hypothetical protein